MTEYEVYVFFLCLIVFVLLVSVFSFMLAVIIKLYLKALRAGLEDESIKTEYTLSVKQRTRSKLQGCIVSVITGSIFLALFAFSLFVNLQEDLFFTNIPAMKMVNSGSMSQKYEKNTYLTANSLNDQFQAFDLIFVYKVPREQELKLYDVVLYEVDGSYIVHRIVGIEEPNDKHPQQRYFLCQGDANEYPDRFPVYYSQIRGIYKGERIPFVGGFVSFLQSPAGWLCLLLVVFCTFGMPALEKRLEKEQLLRLTCIGFIDENGRLLEQSVRVDREEVGVGP